VGVFDEVERDLAAIRLPRWGRVVPAKVVVPWLVVDEDGVPVEPVRRFLVDFAARDTSLVSVRSYAFGLLRWWRWLRAVEVEWDRATPAEARSAPGRGPPLSPELLGELVRQPGLALPTRTVQQPHTDTWATPPRCASPRGLSSRPRGRQPHHHRVHCGRRQQPAGNPVGEPGVNRQVILPA
jgi:hypothetical protein